MDLCKPFDTVNKRLLWARLRSLGVYGKLLRVLCAGYGKRKDFFFGRMRLKKRSERPRLPGRKEDTEKGKWEGASV